MSRLSNVVSVRCAGAFACAILCGCATSGTAEKEAKMGTVASGDEGERTTTAEGLEITRFDLNHDDKPDMIKYTKVVDDVQVVVRKEYDLNFDGKIDVRRFYDDSGELVREQMDYDFDGNVDAENYYEDGEMVRQAADLNFDGKPDMQKFFEKGVIAHLEADTDNDGKVDYWEYYEKGRLDRIGVDRDGDGEVDEWKRAANEEEEEAPATRPAKSAAGQAEG